MTKRDAEKILVVVDGVGGFSCVEEFVQVLAQDACSQVERGKYNRKYLKMLAKEMLLLEWRKSTSATMLG